MKHLKKSFLVLGTIFLVSLFSSNLFAQDEDVTVYNNLDYPIIAVFSAVGWAGWYCGYYEPEGSSLDGNCAKKVKFALKIPANGSDTGTFGAGTSGRHIYIALPGESVTPELLEKSSGSNRDGMSTREIWDTYLVGKKIVITDYDNSHFKVDYQQGGAHTLWVQFRSIGCNPKFDVVGHSKATLTVNDIYFTGIMDPSMLLAGFTGYCDCEKTED